MPCWCSLAITAHKVNKKYCTKKNWYKHRETQTQWYTKKRDIYDTSNHLHTSSYTVIIFASLMTWPSFIRSNIIPKGSVYSPSYQQIYRVRLLFLYKNDFHALFRKSFFFIFSPSLYFFCSFTFNWKFPLKKQQMISA